MRYAAGVGSWDGAGPAGFAHTVLVDMREQLGGSARPDRVFEVALTAAHEAGLVGRRRVLDSTPSYDGVATMDTLTLIPSAIRGLLGVADPVLLQRLRAVLGRTSNPTPTARTAGASPAVPRWRAHKRWRRRRRGWASEPPFASRPARPDGPLQPTDVADVCCGFGRDIVQVPPDGDAPSHAGQQREPSTGADRSKSRQIMDDESAARLSRGRAAESPASPRSRRAGPLPPRRAVLGWRAHELSTMVLWPGLRRESAGRRHRERDA